MSKNKLVFLVGILIVVMPFLGLPPSWKTILYVILGLGLITLSIKNHLRHRARQLEVEESLPVQHEYEKEAI